MLRPVRDLSAGFAQELSSLNDYQKTWLPSLSGGGDQWTATFGLYESGE